MKNLFAAAFIVLFASTAAHAEAYPAYTKDKSAWWVSAIFLGPVAAFDVVGRAADMTGKAGNTFQPLHKATKGIAKHTYEGVCGVPAVGTVCK